MLKTLACRGLRVGPSKVQTGAPSSLSVVVSKDRAAVPDRALFSVFALGGNLLCRFWGSSGGPDHKPKPPCTELTITKMPPFRVASL